MKRMESDGTNTTDDDQKSNERGGENGQPKITIMVR
jgi:hypothetical protein